MIFQIAKTTIQYYDYYVPTIRYITCSSRADGVPIIGLT